MALPDNSVQVSPPLPGISLPHVCCFRQAAWPIALKTALSTALPATSHHLAHEIMILMLLVDHFPNCSQLKGHLINSLVLWADICSPVVWEGEGQLQHWGLACRCCPGTWQWPFSCPTLLRPGGFSFGSPLWREYSCAGSTVWHLASGAVSLMSSLGTVRLQDLLSVSPHVNTVCWPHWDHSCPYLKHSEEGLGEVVECTPPGLHFIEVKLAPKELHPQEWEDDNEEEEKQQQGGNGADWIQEWSHKVTQGVPVSGRENRDS